MITVLGAAFSTVEPTLSSNSMFLAMASRCCAAIRDLGTVELV
jgi:hypothetical protein